MLSDISRCLLSADFYIHFFNISYRVRVHIYTNVIISSILKPNQNFGPDLSPDCLLMFSVVLPPVVIHDQRDRQFQKKTTGILSGRTRRVSGHDA